MNSIKLWCCGRIKDWRLPLTPGELPEPQDDLPATDPAARDKDGRTMFERLVGGFGSMGSDMIGLGKDVAGAVGTGVSIAATGIQTVAGAAIDIAETVATLTGEVIDMGTEAGVYLAKAALEKAGMLPVSDEEGREGELILVGTHGKNTHEKNQKRAQINTNQKKLQNEIPDPMHEMADSAAGAANSKAQGLGGSVQLLNEFLALSYYGWGFQAQQDVRIKQVLTDATIDTIESKIANGDDIKNCSADELLDDVMQSKTPEPGSIHEGRSIWDSFVLKKGTTYEDAIGKWGDKKYDEYSKYNRDLLSAFLGGNQKLTEFYKKNTNVFKYNQAVDFSTIKYLQ